MTTASPRTRIIDGIKFELLEGGEIIAHGSTGNKYVVTLDGTGSEESCQCLGYANRKRCKHVTAAKKLSTAMAREMGEADQDNFGPEAA